MQPAPGSRPRPYRFENLPGLTRNEVLLWNWYSSIAPSGAEWKSWVANIFCHLLERRSEVKVELVQTHLVDSHFGEKVLSFGSKPEIFLGRGTDNDVVLAANAIATRHTRLTLNQGGALLEDLGSQLGTYVWDKKIPPQQVQLLRHGDQFTVFPYRFRVQLETVWTPETEAMVSESTVSPLSRVQFLESSPARWPIFVVESHPADREALLQVSPSFLGSLQQRILAPFGIDRVKQPVPGDDALVEFLVLAALEHVNRSLRFPLQFSLARGKGRSIDNNRGLFLGFAIAVGSLTGHFRIFLPFDFIFTDKTFHPDESRSGYPAGLAWSLPVSAGFVDLSLDEMVQIGLGDIVMAQATPALLFPNDFDKGWWIAEEPSNSRRFRVDKYFERSASVEAGGEAHPATNKPDLKALPLRVQVVLGEREFSLGEIQSLSPGTILELDIAKTDPVRLMVNGKILGEGELVEVEGNLAVKILRWRAS